MSITESAVRAAIQTVVDPNTGRDFVSGKQLRSLSIEGADVSFEIELGYPAKSQIPALGYTVTYAVGNTLLTIWGMVVIMLLS